MEILQILNDSNLYPTTTRIKNVFKWISKAWEKDKKAHDWVLRYTMKLADEKMLAKRCKRTVKQTKKAFPKRANDSPLSKKLSLVCNKWKWRIHHRI